MIWMIFIKIEGYNSNKEHKVLIVFNDMTADMLSKENLIHY